MINFANRANIHGTLMANNDGAYTRQMNEKNERQYWQMIFEPGSKLSFQREPTVDQSPRIQAIR